MSPVGQKRGGKTVPSNNIYTVILAMAFAAVLATAAFAAYKCYFHYETIFKIP